MANRRPKKQVRELLTLADELGWELRWTRNNHLVFVKSGKPLVFTGSTPSDVRAVKNLKAQLARAEAAR